LTGDLYAKILFEATSADRERLEPDRPPGNSGGNLRLGGGIAAS
jgi:hypothetical protein